MKSFSFLLLFSFLFTGSFSSSAQKRDTITITSKNLDHKAVKFGEVSYLVFNKKSIDAPATGLYISNISVAPIKINNQTAIAISQKWDARDTVAHTAYTVLSSVDFSTLLHETWWIRLPYKSKFDFVSKQVSCKGAISDSTSAKIKEAFNESFEHYNLNWHSDLFIFTLLPYRANTSFKINFYDPGFGKPQDVIYNVTGSEKLKTYTGIIDCWVMELNKGADYQKFWIDKKEKVVIKEEDFFSGKYRYKIKLDVAPGKSIQSEIF